MLTSRGAVAGFVRLIRAREWWDSKIPFALGSVYALDWYEDISLTSLWRPLLLLLSSGITAAIFASVFNDLLDQREDRLAGKVTGIMHLSRAGKGAALAAIELLMLMQALLLAPYPNACLVFLVIWALYTAYSLPPIRLKERGPLGVLCIAFGEHVSASLLGVTLVLDAIGRRPPLLWLSALLMWCLALGCRSILWHQLCDYDNDRRTNTGTLATRMDADTLRRLGERGVFPVEATTLLVLLTLTGNAVSWLLLAGHLVMAWLRRRYFGESIVIVAPRPKFQFALLEYYQFLFPLAFLISGTATDPHTAVLLAIQCLLFPAPLYAALRYDYILARCRFIPFLIAHAPAAIRRRRSRAAG